MDKHTYEPAYGVVLMSVNKMLDRCGIATKEGDYWRWREVFESTGQDILREACKAAAMATMNVDRSYDKDANKAMTRVVEPALRGIMNCASQIGGYDYTIPMKLRKSVPSPSRMKSIYFPYVAVDYKRALPFRWEDLDKEELQESIFSSWYYRKAKQAAEEKRHDFEIHDDLDHGEFEKWRNLGRNLNKDLDKMRYTKWGVSVNNKEILAQCLMGLASKVYILWRDLSDDVYLRQEGEA